MAPTPSRNVTMYSSGIASPTSRSSGDSDEAMVLVVVLGVEVVVDEVVDVDDEVDDEDVEVDDVELEVVDGS